MQPNRARGTESNSRAVNFSTARRVLITPNGPRRRVLDPEPEQPPRESGAGVTQPKLVLQVPEAGAVLRPLPEKVGLAVLPPLEHLGGEREEAGLRKVAGSEFSILGDKLGQGALPGRAGVCTAGRSLDDAAPSPGAEAPTERPAVMLTPTCTQQCRKDSDTASPQTGQLVALRSVLCTRQCSRQHFSPREQAPPHISSDCRRPTAGKELHIIHFASCLSAHFISPPMHQPRLQLPIMLYEGGTDMSERERKCFPSVAIMNTVPISLRLNTPFHAHPPSERRAAAGTLPSVMGLQDGQGP